MNRREAQRLLGRSTLPGHQRLVLGAYLRSLAPDDPVEGAELVLGRTRLRTLSGLTARSNAVARDALARWVSS